MSAKLSIVTVCYNAELIIEQTILSVLNQTYDSIEYLIIDGGSSDGTLELINKYRKSITKIVSEPDSGIYNAMNKGLSMASGDFILFLNAGDTLENEIVVSEIMKHSEQAGVIYGETHLINENGEILGTRSQLTTRKLPDQLTKRSFLQGQVVSHQAFIARVALASPFNERYKCSSDIDWMLSIVSKTDRIKNVGIIISRYLLGGESDRKLRRCWKERFVILLKNFSFWSVLRAHLLFVVRYLRFGAYKIEP